MPAWAAPDKSADDYADEWTEARRGDRDWMQRATEQLTMGPVDRIIGPSAEGVMNQIIARITGHIDQLYRQRMDPCLAAAVNQAKNQAIVTERKHIMRGATEMFLSTAQGAAGGGNIAEFLGKTLYEKVKDEIKSRAIDKFKDEMRERMKEGLPVYFEDDNSGGLCTSEFRIVWDKRAERYEFLYAGDCQCSIVSCGYAMFNRTISLRRWTIVGRGSVIPQFAQMANGDIKITYQVGLPGDVQITADCCGEGERRFRTAPRDGPGNEWVGFVRLPPQPAPPSGRPQTGGASTDRGPTGAAGQPTTPSTAGSGPPRQQIVIPAVPDRAMTREELEQLGEQLHAAQERARNLHRAAVTYRSQLDNRSTPVSEADIRDADAAVEEAANAARRARAALDKVMEKFSELDQEQSSRTLDPASSRIHAIHNAERAAVGAPPLIWDPRLQASAQAWAANLARTGRLVHAPRQGRGEDRENLSQGMIGWTPDRMLASWTTEKRHFVPGVYPDVSRTGRWEDVSHYTQMIWPSTTHIGCGMAIGSGHQWLVCRYSPGGNKDGKPVG